ncbi:hypothetical protein D3C71_1872970 [compost metagenome]
MFNKVIVSEKLEYLASGTLTNDLNYIEVTENNIIDKIKDIRNNDLKKNEIRKNNLNYYLNYLKPDVLILNCIKVVLGD